MESVGWKMSDGVAWNQGELSEETRAMIREQTQKNYQRTVFKMIDDICRPNHIPPRIPKHHILLDELEMLYEAHMTIGGEQNRFNASVLRAAINVITTL
jgi:hypothetical protein